MVNFLTSICISMVQIVQYSQRKREHLWGEACILP